MPDRPTRFNPPRMDGADPHVIEAVAKETESYLNRPFWVTGVVTMQSWPPSPPDAGATEPQTEEGSGPQPVVIPTISVPQTNDILNGMVIRSIDVPHTVLAVTVTTVHATEGSDAVNHLQVRLRDWEGERWIGGIFSSLDAEFGPVPNEREVEGDIQLEAGSSLGAVGIIEGAGPTIRGARTVTLDVLLQRR